MKKLLVPGAVALTIAVAAVPAFAATRTVKVEDNKFGPTTLTVKKGSTVKFRWTGKQPHNVKRVSGPSFRSIDTRTKGTVSRRLTKRGTYRLMCTIHPRMDLTLRVR